MVEAEPGGQIADNAFAALTGGPPWRALDNYLAKFDYAETPPDLYALLQNVGLSREDAMRASKLLFSVPDNVGTRGPALRELIAGAVARTMGFDSIVAYPGRGVKGPIHEVFDLREAAYPGQGKFTLHPELQQRVSASQAPGYDPEAVARANRTSRTTGKFGEDAVVPKLIPQMFNPEQAGEVLDFGSGKPPTHAATLREMGYDVTAHDFGVNVDPTMHDPNALARQYDTVYASRVLNTQENAEMMDRTLAEIAKATRPDGRAVMNYPGDPRRWDDPNGPKLKGVGKASPATVEAHIRKHFRDVRKIGDDNGRPIWEARNPITAAPVAGDGQRMGIVQQAPQRAFHGTSTAYDRPDPGRFSPEGLWGPGYYKTVDPRVAANYAAATAKPAGSEAIPDVLEDLARRAESDPRIYPDNPQARATLVEWVRKDIADHLANPNPNRRASSALYSARMLDGSDAWSWLVREVEQSIPNEGAQIRAVDIPKGMRYLDIEQALPEEELDILTDAVRQAGGDAEGFRDDLASMETRGYMTNGMQVVRRPPTGRDAYGAIQQVFGWEKTRTNRFLAQAGFDGITHQGGNIMPMPDPATGLPIQHQVFVTFEEGLPKLRNAVSGQPMGVTPRGAAPGGPSLEDALTGVSGRAARAGWRRRNDLPVRPGSSSGPPPAPRTRASGTASSGGSPPVWSGHGRCGRPSTSPRLSAATVRQSSTAWAGWASPGARTPTCSMRTWPGN